MRHGERDQAGRQQRADCHGPGRAGRFSPALGFVVCFTFLTLAPVCRAAAPDAGQELAASLVCEPAPGPGRAVCLLELQVAGGELMWADAVVLQVPEFAEPLRSRVVATEQQEKQSSIIKLAFLAQAEGTGEVRVLGRAVVCPESRDHVCRPVSRAVSAKLTVGGGGG